MFMILINDDLEIFEENDRMPIIKFKSVPAYRPPGQGSHGESGDFEVKEVLTVKTFCF
jgi:hypothetical protein